MHYQGREFYLSFIITMYVREGIVMAADSRLTVNGTIQQSDSNSKLFLAPGNIGISTCGQADIGGVPIAGYIESFINEKLADGSRDIEEVPGLLMDYFKALKSPPATIFHIAGYKVENGRSVQRVFIVNIKTGQITRNNLPDPGGNEVQGATWGGETDVLVRLIQQLYIKDQKGNYQPLPGSQILWGFFTLQDAIDYAVFAVRTTIDSIRFQTRPKTVGGPIDVLVIKPNEAFWVQKKKLSI
jgi:20S proteasome alpha/beta subunit